MNAKVQSVNRVEDKAIVTFADSQTNEVFVLEADALLLATRTYARIDGHIGVIRQIMVILVSQCTCHGLLHRDSIPVELTSFFKCGVLQSI